MLHRLNPESKLAIFIKKYRIFWAVVTVAVYILMIPVTIILFPNNSMWLALLVLFSGFTASLTTLGDLLVSSEDSSS